jgi:phosphoribosyl-AMP cyclohydrolase
VRKETSKSSQEGLKDGWTRATFILKKDRLEKIKLLAYWERKQVKQVMEEALGDYLSRKRIKPMRNK